MRDGANRVQVFLLDYSLPASIRKIKDTSDRINRMPGGHDDVLRKIVVPRAVRAKDALTAPHFRPGSCQGTRPAQ
jgi:hypothetical protein